MVLDTSCLTLSTIGYGSRVKWSNPRKGAAPSPTLWCSSYWKVNLQIAFDCCYQLYLLFYISYRDHITNKLVRKRITAAFGLYDSLFIIVKKGKMVRYGLVTRSSEREKNHPARRRKGEITPGNGQVCLSPRSRELFTTEIESRWLLMSHQWCLYKPTWGYGASDEKLEINPTVKKRTEMKKHKVLRGWFHLSKYCQH